MNTTQRIQTSKERERGGRGDLCPLSCVSFYDIKGKVDLLPIIICRSIFHPCFYCVLADFHCVVLFLQIILASWLNLVGSVLRNLTTMDFLSSGAKYPVLLFGQFLAACAQPFIMFVPTKLAAVWFPDTQRALANTLASMGEFQV